MKRETTLRWFGRSWNAPICQPEERVDSPVGRPCLGCNLPILAEDQGVMLPFMSIAPEGAAVTRDA